MQCLRKTGHVLSKVPALEVIGLPSPMIQFTRGIKPRWLPKSKSKIFYVRTPTPIDPEESAELRTAYFHYRAHVRAVRKFLVDQHLAKFKAMREQSAADDRDHAAELLQMEEMNNQWNSRVASAREAAWLEEKEKQESRHRRRMERDEANRARRQEKAQERLQQNLEAAESFITLENLDTEIEKLLNVRQDYNFAIDKQGNKIPDESEVDTPKTSSQSQ